MPSFGWLTKPFTNDIPFIWLLAIGVIFVVVCVWASDSVRLMEGL